MPKIMRGKYGLGFYKAALMVHADRILHHSYHVPFFYDYVDVVHDDGTHYKKVNRVFNVQSSEEWVKRL